VDVIMPVADNEWAAVLVWGAEFEPAWRSFDKIPNDINIEAAKMLATPMRINRFRRRYSLLIVVI